MANVVSKYIVWRLESAQAEFMCKYYATITK